jgi:hypothetical protein
MFSSIHQDNYNDCNDIEFAYFKDLGIPNHFGWISDKVEIIAKTHWIKIYGSLAKIILIV